MKLKRSFKIDGEGFLLVGRLALHEWSNLTKRQRRQVISWLRKTTNRLEQDPDEYANHFTARLHLEGLTP